MANGVMVVLSDMTAYKTGWHKLDKLPQHLEYLIIVALHQQSPEPQSPNQVKFLGREMAYVHGTNQGLLVGGVDPQGHTESSFDAATGDQELHRDIVHQLRQTCMDHSHAQWISYPVMAADYEAKTDAAQLIDPADAVEV